MQIRTCITVMLDSCGDGYLQFYHSAVLLTTAENNERAFAFCCSVGCILLTSCSVLVTQSVIMMPWCWASLCLYLLFLKCWQSFQSFPFHGTQTMSVSSFWSKYISLGVFLCCDPQFTVALWLIKQHVSGWLLIEYRLVK